MEQPLERGHGRAVELRRVGAVEVVTVFRATCFFSSFR
jgi:hypothetical protein